MQATPKLTYKDILRDFKQYLIVKWHWLGLSKPTDLQMEFGDFLQNRKIDRKMLKAFRGAAKSWITASFCEWMWLENRDYRFLLVSGNQRKADEISLFIRRCIDEFPILEPIRWADWEKQHVRWGIQQFNIKGAPPDIAPSCKAASIESMLTGSRAHHIIGDDIETPNNSLTVDARASLLAQVGEFESILLPGGTVTLLGTPQSEESVYNEIENRGYASLIAPLRVPTVEERGIYRDRLSPLIDKMYADGLHGQSTEPTRFDEETLLQKEAGMTKAAWRLQMMLDTSLADADRYPLKLRDILVMSTDSATGPMTMAWSGHEKHRVPGLPMLGFTGDYMVNPMFIGDDWKPYDRKFMWVDPSGRGDNETAWFVFGTLAGRYHVLDFGGTTDGYSEETLDMLIDKAMEFQVNEVAYEDNMGDGMFGAILGARMKLRYQCAITGRRSSGQKERRIIDTLEPVMRSHKLVINQSALERDAAIDQRGYSLGYQISRLTKERGSLRYDDRVDGLAGGIAHCQQVAGVNSKEAVELAQKLELEKSIDNLLANSQTFSFFKDHQGAIIKQLPPGLGKGRQKLKLRRPI